VVPNRVAGDTSTGPVRTGPVAVPAPPEREVRVDLPAAVEQRQPYQPPSMPAPAYEAPAAQASMPTSRPYTDRPFPAAPPFAPQPQPQPSSPQPRMEQHQAPAVRADDPRRERPDPRQAPPQPVPVWARDEPAEQPRDRRWEQQGSRAHLPSVGDEPGFGTALFSAPRHPDGSPGRGLDEDLAMTTGRWSLGETRPVAIPPDIHNTGDPDGVIRRVGRHRTPGLENLDFVAGLNLPDTAQNDEVGPSS
jgi:hypothetical protein